MKKFRIIFTVLILIFFSSSACQNIQPASDQSQYIERSPEATAFITSASSETDPEHSDILQFKAFSSFEISDIPEYIGLPYTEVNGNIPFFKDIDFDEDLLKLTEPDEFGRCGQVIACLGTNTMPTEERQGIGMIKPSGWHTAKYPDIIDDIYLYNRCHLLAYQLTGINADTRNLITGTRYMNVNGMLHFEDKTASYIKNTGNHVIYRVTPIFEKNELVARGVLMEAYSVEDNGNGLMFCSFCYNVQPGIIIDYSSGESEADMTSDNNKDEYPEYILNRKTHKIHLPDCQSVSRMSEKNKLEFQGDIQELISSGYSPCKECEPEKIS